MKIITAAIAIATVIFMWPLLPGLAHFSSDLVQMNDRLRREVRAHEATLRELEAAGVELEDRVEERTQELSRVNEKLATALREAGRSEEHLRLLLREITHRSKNLLAVIQAMARQTGRTADDVDTFLERFSARVQALARSHDLLVQESWHGAPLPDLVRSQLAAYLDGAAAQVSVGGPVALLRPEAAQSLGLALHELAVNAARYGALSVPAGHVDVTWRELSAEDGDGVEFVWAETGGPEVAPPVRRGFGCLVIERNHARSIDCAVDLSFLPGGVQCRLRIPSSQLA
jgi:two-component sensor histidine kinase